MGNSSVTIQKIVDSVSTIGDLNPILTNTGGYANEPAVTISNDVAMELFSERFPWKWNRFKLPPFFLTNTQQDYGMLGVYRIGWLENGYRMNMNTTQIPPPSWPITVVRDLQVSRVGVAGTGWPAQACWFPNEQLEWGVWPGPGVQYIDPLNTVQNPNNPTTNIALLDGSLLILTKYGTTGLIPPVIPPPPPLALPNYPVGITVVDGTTEWTVADPYGQGIRIYPPPSGGSGGNVWLIRLFAQRKAPVFDDIKNLLDPIPDDQVKWFRDGFIAYCHRYSSVPAVKARFPQMKADWFQAMADATKQADREDESKGFYPDRSIMSPEYYTDPGPGNPYWRGTY